MVVFMDLNHFSGGVPAHHHQSMHWAGREVPEKAVDLGSRPNPNINAMTEALGCYPYVPPESANPPQVQGSPLTL